MRRGGGRRPQCDVSAATWENHGRAGQRAPGPGLSHLAAVMDKLTFPQFPLMDLVNFFRQNILTGAEAKNFTKSDLYPNPKPEWNQKLFMRVLQKVYNVGIEQFYMVPVGLDIQYPHLMEGFAPVACIVKLMDRFLPLCLIYDFHSSDVLNPKGKRTAHLLSGIVNFLHFRETRKVVYTSFCLKYKSIVDNISQQQKTIQELEAKIEKLSTVPPEQQAEFKTLSSEIQDLQQSISQEYRGKDLVLQEKIAQEKADLAEKMKKLNQHKLFIATMKEEQESMKSQVVESPEQRKNKTERMKENVHRLKEARQETSEKCDHYRERVTMACLWQSDVQAYNKKLHSMKTYLEMYRKILEEARQKDEQIVNKNLELKSGATEETQFKRSIQIKKEKLAKMDIKNQKKVEDFLQRKNENLEICSHIQEKRQAMHGRVSHVLQEIRQISNKKDQLLEAVEKDNRKCQEVMTGFRNALEKYHDSLQKVSDRSAARRKEKVAELSRRLNLR
ncbi:kinetochore protein Nuf2 isoform X1 [Ranitomeya variabilis]|uniref:kinetochore protein Nuf2 isoform X1 n=2 Tax=Ranitomeya variabilis TaxID=490064 RepID=UPI0040569D0C